jgi:hypothetical protein
MKSIVRHDFFTNLRKIMEVDWPGYYRHLGQEHLALRKRSERGLLVTAGSLNERGPARDTV